MVRCDGMSLRDMLGQNLLMGHLHGAQVEHHAPALLGLFNAHHLAERLDLGEGRDAARVGAVQEGEGLEVDLQARQQLRPRIEGRGRLAGDLGDPGQERQLRAPLQFPAERP